MIANLDGIVGAGGAGEEEEVSLHCCLVLRPLLHIFFRINDAMNFINLWIEAFTCKTVRQSQYILFIH